MVKKGIGISNILLVLYNLLSGLLLYTSLYTIYSYNHTYLLSKHILVLYLASHYNNVSDNQSLTYSVLCILLSGFIKLAVYPFHIWLGKVHVEAPTVGSILLAGVSLKTGFFIHLYFLTYINSIPVTYLYTMIVVLFIGVVFNCLNVFYQIDSKRWIALYSIIHMNLYYLHIFIILIGFIHLNHSVSMFILMVLVYGMIGHSIISGGLFLVIGYVYDVSNTKNLLLNFTFQVLSSTSYFILFILLLANSSLPLHALFLYEFISFMLVTQFNLVLSFLLLTLSCSNLLSSLYVFYKYLYSIPMLFNIKLTIILSFDLLLSILTIPIISFVALMLFSLIISPNKCLSSI
jgi:NADH:ubiquinone oxidoreductase subunit 4 (subunit M)